MIGSPSFFTEHVVARNYYFKFNKLGLNNVFYLVYVYFFKPLKLFIPKTSRKCVRQSGL